MRKYIVPLALVAIIAAVSVVAYAGMTRVTGEISSIDTEARTLIVGDTTVHVTDAATILDCGEAATFEDLQVGQTVRVVGQDTDGEFTATRVCICDPDCPGGQQGQCGDCPYRKGCGPRDGSCPKQQCPRQECPRQ